VPPWSRGDFQAGVIELVRREGLQALDLKTYANIPAHFAARASSCPEASVPQDGV
jgi:hypothetical protein